MQENSFPSYKVAAIQTNPVMCDKKHNTEDIVAKLEAAASQGVILAVLPELANTGYMFSSREEAFSQAEPVPEGDFARTLIDVARRLKIYIVSGVTELDGECLYNSSFLVGPEGYIGKYRKNHLWGDENLFFEPGDLGMPVYRTAIGRIGMIICFDGWFPELYRLASMQGADIICCSTNWVPMKGQPEDTLAMSNILAMGAAHSNALNIICADRCGVERGQPFIGRSIVVGPEGWLLAGPASATDECTLTASINIKATREARQFNKLNNIVRDRRDDFYDPMLGTKMPLTHW